MYEFRACAEKKSTDLHSCLDRPDRLLLRGLDPGPVHDKILLVAPLQIGKPTKKGTQTFTKKKTLSEGGGIQAKT